MWTLGAPAMLGWLAAAIIPLVLLWWHRSRRIEMKFAAMQFLERALARQGRRSWLQWLVVALQMLALTLLALAWGNFQFGRSSAGKTWQVLIIDATLSMRATGADRRGPLFERALAQARQIVRQAQPDDFFSVFVVRHQGDAIIGQPTNDPEQVLRQLDQLQATYEAGDFGSATRLLHRVMQANKDPSVPRQVIVHAISDFQRSTWKAPAGRFPDPDKFVPGHHVTWKLHDVGPPLRDGVYVTALRSDDPWLFAGESTAFAAEIENASQHVAQVPLSWRVDGIVIARETVEVPAAERATAQRRLPLSSLGEHLVTVSIENEPLETGGSRSLMISVREQLRVLALGSDPTDTHPAAIAMAPEASAKVLVEEIADLKKLAGDLLEYDALLLANLPGLSEAEQKSVIEYLGHGGGVIVLLGDRSRAEEWQQIHWLPAAVISTSVPEMRTFSRPDYQHPILRPFQQGADGGLFVAPTWQHFRLQKQSDEIVLEFNDQSLAAATSPGIALWGIPWSGNGEVELASGQTAPWTSLDQWPCFVPLVQETLQYVTAFNAGPSSVEAGESLKGIVPRTGAENSLSIVRPDQRHERPGVIVEGKRWSWSYERTDLPGIYELHQGDAPPKKVAVNVPAAELSAERVNAADWGGPASAAAVVGQLAGVPWFRLFFAAAFAVLMGETLLAWQLGRRSP